MGFEPTISAVTGQHFNPTKLLSHMTVYLIILIKIISRLPNLCKKIQSKSLYKLGVRYKNEESLNLIKILINHIYTIS